MTNCNDEYFDAMIRLVKVHPEDREGRPETRGLEGAEGERRTYVQPVEAVGQEKQGKTLFHKKK